MPANSKQTEELYIKRQRVDPQLVKPPRAATKKLQLPVDIHHPFPTQENLEKTATSCSMLCGQRQAKTTKTPLENQANEATQADTSYIKHLLTKGLIKTSPTTALPLDKPG